MLARYTIYIYTYIKLYWTYNYIHVNAYTATGEMQLEQSFLWPIETLDLTWVLQTAGKQIRGVLREGN